MGDWMLTVYRLWNHKPKGMRMSAETSNGNQRGTRGARSWGLFDRTERLRVRRRVNDVLAGKLLTWAVDGAGR